MALPRHPCAGICSCVEQDTKAASQRMGAQVRGPIGAVLLSARRLKWETSHLGSGRPT